MLLSTSPSASGKGSIAIIYHMFIEGLPWIDMEVPENKWGPKCSSKIRAF
jgi:hypothetical protein